MLKILIFVFLLNQLSFAYISDAGPEFRKNDSLISITQELFYQHYSCLHSMVNAPHCPVFTRTYFQSLPDSKVLAIKCEELNTSSTFNFVFISEKDVLLLDLPKYIAKDFLPNGNFVYKEYPRDVVSFSYNGNNFYLDLEGSDMAKILKSDELIQIATNLKISKNKLQNDFIGKYQTHLQARHLSHRSQLRSASDKERDVIISCLNKKQQNILSVYLQSEVQAKLPDVDQMQHLLTKRSLGQVPRERYLQVWEEVESNFQSEFYKSNPHCIDLIKRDTLTNSLRSNLSNHKKYYVRVRERLAKEESLVLGRTEN